MTKYRKPTLEGKIEKIAKDSFLEVAHNKRYNILEIEANKDHAHLLVEAEDKTELANIVRVLKSVSAKKILQEQTPHLRVGNIQHFWARGYGHKIVYEPQLQEIRNYIRNQKRIPHT